MVAGSSYPQVAASATGRRREMRPREEIESKVLFPDAALSQGEKLLVEVLLDIRDTESESLQIIKETRRDNVVAYKSLANLEARIAKLEKG